MLSRLAPRAIRRATRVVALVAGDDAARRAELAGAFATVLATVGSFVSGRRAKRILEEMERSPELSFESVLAQLEQFGEQQRELAEAEVRRMVTHLGDAIAPQAIRPMLCAVAVWCEEGLQREDCVNACRALRDLDATELEQLAQLVGEALQRSDDAELRLLSTASGDVSLCAGPNLLALSRAQNAQRLLQRLGDCDLARGEGSEFVLKRRRAELLRRILG
ncbi:MAG TPA: hypothetical protein VM686_06710 [Polyangiaceae bacterium]|nr:hypothetical protein [Polyangiaceae bacterium]